MSGVSSAETRPSFGWPLNLKQWVDDNRHLLKPPVGNKVVYEDTEFIIMIVGGPNTRTDYHVDPAEEFFYMLEGDMVLKCVDERATGEGGPKDNPQFVDVPIGEGEIFLLPALVPHSPQRKENTVGLVVERRRNGDEIDAMQWYCDACGTRIYREEFKLRDITKDLPPVMDNFFSSEENRSCPKCDWVHPPKG